MVCVMEGACKNLDVSIVIMMIIDDNMYTE